MTLLSAPSLLLKLIEIQPKQPLKSRAMRIASRVGLLVGSLGVVGLLGGCGSTGRALLTQGAATQLSSELNQASTALGAYNCEVAYTALTNFSNDVNQLTGVNATLVQMLSQGASRITSLANQRCPSGVSSDTGTRTTSSGTTTTSPSTTTTTPTTVTTTGTTTSTPSDTSTGTGGAAPTTPTTTSVPSVSTVTSTPTPPATTPDSGGAGLNTGAAGSAGAGGGAAGGTGIGGGNGQ